jgi:hypothetical protein
MKIEIKCDGTLGYIMIWTACGDGLGYLVNLRVRFEKKHLTSRWLGCWLRV